MSRLPGIGRRTALRLVLHLLGQESHAVHELAASLVRLRDEVRYCRVCHNISDTDTCDICANPLRDHSVVCVVENVRGVLSIENTGQFRGLYHVLGGVISPVDGVGPADLELDSLVERVKAGGIDELILALNPTMEGDTTNFYIQRRLEGTGVKLSARPWRQCGRRTGVYRRSDARTLAGRPPQHRLNRRRGNLSYWRRRLRSVRPFPHLLKYIIYV